MQLINYTSLEHQKFFRDLKYDNLSEDIDFALASGVSDSESDWDLNDSL